MERKMKFYVLRTELILTLRFIKYAQACNRLKKLADELGLSHLYVTSEICRESIHARVRYAMRVMFGKNMKSHALLP